MKFSPPVPFAAEKPKRSRSWQVYALVLPWLTLLALDLAFDWHSGWLFLAVGVLTILMLIVMILDAFRKDGRFPPPEDTY